MARRIGVLLCGLLARGDVAKSERRLRTRPPPLKNSPLPVAPNKTEPDRGAVYAAMGPEYLDMTMMGALRLEYPRVLLVVDAKSVAYCDARKAVLRRPHWTCAAVNLTSLAVAGARDDVAIPSDVEARWRRLREGGDGGFRGLGAHVSRGIEGRVLGILAMLASPYRDTLFLDSDTFPCETLRTLFGMLEVQQGAPNHEDIVYGVKGMLDAVDVLMAHEYHTLMGFLGEEAHGIPDAYGLLNAGVVLYRRKDRVVKFLHKWLALYLKDLEKKIGNATAYDPAITRNFQRQPAMQWAMYSGLAHDGLRVHPLSPIWNARSWSPVLTGLRKRDPRNHHDCCTQAPDPTHILIDHHCNVTLLAPECGFDKKAKFENISDLKHVPGIEFAYRVRPRYGCPHKEHSAV